MHAHKNKKKKKKRGQETRLTVWHLYKMQQSFLQESACVLMMV